MEPLSKFLGVTKFPFELYDEQGNLTYRENSYGFWIKREYNKQGRLIYHENSNGFWYKSEYNEQGNWIYHENSNGFWIKREYNEQGRLIYHENSNEFWSKSEYDEQGNLIYHEDSIKGTTVGKRQYSRSVDVPGIGKVSIKTIREALKEKFGKNENKNK